MWQKCPVCDGTGIEYPRSNLGYTERRCSVCDGKKIINQQTGQPPEQQTIVGIEGFPINIPSVWTEPRNGTPDPKLEVSDSAKTPEWLKIAISGSDSTTHSDVGNCDTTTQETRPGYFIETSDCKLEAKHNPYTKPVVDLGK